MWNINLESFTKTSTVRVSRVIEVCAPKCLAAKIRSFQLSICIFFTLDTVVQCYFSQRLLVPNKKVPI